MSRRIELDLKVSFPSQGVLIAFLTNPPMGIRVSVAGAATTPPVATEIKTPRPPQRPPETATRGSDVLLPRRNWTSEEEETLLDLYTKGTDLAEIGVQLSRTYSAIYSRLAKMGAFDKTEEPK